MLNIFKKTKKLNNPITVEVNYGDDILKLETGRFAKQADGAVMATIGGTMVLSTVCFDKDAEEGQDFFPLTVDYQEKYASAGKIPGSRDRREGKATNSEILIARLIDRPIRPLFPDNFKNKVQIISQVFSYDKKHQPDIISMIASSAALAISGVPFLGPIGAARIAYIDNKYVLNPSKKDLKDSKMDLVVSATKDGVLMVESEIQELDEKIVLGGVKFGFEQQQDVIKAILKLKEKAGKETVKIEPEKPEYNEIKLELNIFNKDIKQILTIKEKQKRANAFNDIRDVAFDKIKDKYIENININTLKIWINEIIDNMTANIMRTSILNGEKRIDGRDNTTIRPIEIELGVLPYAHGSALFTRGETQALVSTTLGSNRDALPVESLDGDSDQSWFLNYNFPGYSVGEVKGLKAPGRRELGHGNLAYRALNYVMPNKEEFDYTVRVLSDILESNGSSSMATTCGGCLALMDAGVPIKKPVAGIAMGLIKEGKNYVVLTDILGDEDHLGDMDFKVTGTKDGITALQMDIKITSITFEIMKKALEQAKDGRLFILDKITKAIKKPRANLSDYAPQTETIKINPDKIRDVIGKGGVTIQALTKETDTQIDINDDGTLKIMGMKDCINQVKHKINEIIAEPEVGTIYKGVVSGIKDFGIFVKFLNSYEAMVHISEITGKRLNKIEDAKIKEGDTVFVEYQGTDRRGKLKLSMVGINQKTGRK